MGFVLDPEYLLRVGKIVLIDLALAGDNAVVIALAVRTLARRQQLLGRLWGTAGAVGLRILFIAIATYLLRVPLLQVVGGLLLLWIAVKLVRQSSDGDAHGKVRHGTSLLEAVWIIIVADVVMSLDNVLAVAGAAEGDLALVVFGIGLSIPIVVWGSGVLAALMNRYGWIILVAAGVLGEVAGKMIVHDAFLIRQVGDVPDWMEWLLRLTLAAGIMLFGWLVSRRRALPSGEVAAS
ncbi:MAG TPA: TerC family protein [Methylomirabilota bacterium]|jgi:YjbE family integral membrane protein